MHVGCEKGVNYDLHPAQFNDLCYLLCGKYWERNRFRRGYIKGAVKDTLSLRCLLDFQVGMQDGQLDMWVWCSRELSVNR